jgi:hypothetical protein
LIHRAAVDFETPEIRRGANEPPGMAIAAGTFLGLYQGVGGSNPHSDEKRSMEMAFDRPPWSVESHVNWSFSPLSAHDLDNSDDVSVRGFVAVDQLVLTFYMSWWHTIVGVVASEKIGALNEDATAVVYAFCDVG